MERSEFITRLFALAAPRGGSAEVCYETDRAFEAQVKEGQIVHYNVSESGGLGFRVLKDGHTGGASTQILDGEALTQLVDSAYENAALMESEDPRFMYAGDPEYPVLDLYNPAVDALTAARKIDMAKELERLTLSLDPRVRQVEDCAIFSTSGERIMKNTLGLDVSTRSAVLGGYVVAVAREGGKVNTGMKVFVTMDPDKVDLKSVAGAAVKEAVDGLDGQPVKSGKYRVLIRNTTAAALLSTFSGIFSADNAQKGLSRMKGREGQDVAARCVTIFDDPHRPGSAASAPFDGEGVATRKKAVVEGGRLNTLLHNLKTANKQGVPTTANGSRSSYAAGVGVAPTNFHFAPSDKTFEQMLEITGDGLYITDLQGMHAGANAITGDFSLAAKGFVIEGGKITTPVSRVTLAGNFYKLLEDVEAVGSDLEFRTPGVSCFGSPCILVKELSVAGV